MDVASSSQPSSVEAAASAILGRYRAALVVGAAGFGKTSVLHAAAAQVEQATGSSVLWLNGAIVGSEAHLARMIAAVTDAAGPLEQDLVSRANLRLLFGRLAEISRPPLLLAVDDVDALFFKREELADIVGEALASDTGMRFLGSCHPSTCDRLTRTSSFGRRLDYGIATVKIAPFDDEEARELVLRRVPDLPEKACSVVVREAGGHPAALVFLARLAELQLRRTPTWGSAIDELLDRAGEFAGSVYAESWALLGPQQRAILWQLGTAPETLTAAAVAEAVELPAPQVSAQLGRLIDEGLVIHTDRRAHYSVAPLMSRWIALRAARGRSLARDLEGVKALSTGLGWSEAEANR